MTKSVLVVNYMMECARICDIQFSINRCKLDIGATVAQFGSRPHDKTSSKVLLAKYLLSSYVAVAHPLVLDAVCLSLST